MCTSTHPQRGVCVGGLWHYISNILVKCDPGIDLLDPVAAVEALEDAWLLPLLLLLLVLRGRDVRER